MTLNPAIWRPIALGLTVINLVGIGWAVRADEPAHAAAHVVLALACGWWAARLRRTPRVVGGEDRLDVLSDEMDVLRRQLSETQERLDFAERLLAQRPESRRVGPEG